MSQELFASVENSLKVLRKEVMAIPELKDSEKDINEIIENMNSPLLVMVMGEFSRGKSTFINALIGQSIAKVDANPTTAVITKLSYGTQDEITVFMRDGSARSYDTDSFAALTAEGDEEAGKLHERIDYVERKMPIDILKTMSIIDSPGLNSIKTVHEETTKKFMDKSDMVIWLFDAQDPGKSTEIDAMKRLNPRLSPLVLVNKMDAINEDEGDSPEKIISKIERDLSNNKLEYQKIIGISAKMAFQGKIKNNEKLIAESNIDGFYDTVDTVILPNKEKYKRNSMLDGLAKVMFFVGNVLNEKRAANNKRKNRDYATYIETEESLSVSFDELENIADIVMTEVELAQETRRNRLNPAEKSLYGVLHWLGLFVEKNNEISQQYLEEAAIRNDTIAQVILVEVYTHLHQTDRMVYWRKKVYAVASNAGKDAGKFEYERGESCEANENYKEAIQWYQKADALGNADASFRIAEIYCNYYDDTDIDEEELDKEAMKWFVKAASLGNADAMFRIADDFDYDDKAKQMELYTKAANAGSADAVMYFAQKYEAEKNTIKALEWYQKAADMGKVDAKTRIAVLKLLEKLNQTNTVSNSSYAVEVQPNFNNKFRIVVIGEFSRGKSAFINALLGQHLLPSGIVPNTKVFTTIVYGDTLKYRIYLKGMSVPQKISQDEFFAMNSGFADSDDFSFIERTEISCALCKDNVEMLDTPGVGGYDVERMENVCGYINTADAVMLMLSASGTLSQSDVQFIKHCVRDDKKRNIFFVISHKDELKNIKEEQQSVNAVSDAVLKIFPEVDLQNRVFLVDSRGALLYRRKQNGEALTSVQESVASSVLDDTGFPELEAELKALIDDKMKFAAAKIYSKGRSYDSTINIVELKNKGTQNYEEAIKGYRNAMDSGCEESEKNFKDLETQLKKENSQISDIDRIYAKGQAYHFGEGEEKDYIKAANYYLEAAKLGHNDAMKMLGYMYKNGFGVVQSYTKAEEWYRKAILAGNKYAERELSRMLFTIKEENKQRREQTSSKSSCFITSAVCESFGKSNDCYELTVFREFRDNWLIKQADGKALIREYYRVAPHIVEQIKFSPNAREIYIKIWEQYLRPCLYYIEKGDNLHCKKMYVAMVNYLRKKFF